MHHLATETQKPSILYLKDFIQSVLLMCFLLLLSVSVFAQIDSSFPEKINTHEKYIFYLHGKIIEDKGIKPTHPQLGEYDYIVVRDAFSSVDTVVVSERREKNTNVHKYADKVNSQIQTLIKAGVPEQHISVVGFSKGGVIARLVSDKLAMPDVRFVLLGACWTGDTHKNRKLTGHVLSVRETSDILANASCEPIAKKSNDISSFKEIYIHTGKSHGAFYQPYSNWVEPVLMWLKEPQTK